jgi:hypothetical protein
VRHQPGPMISDLPAESPLPTPVAVSGLRRRLATRSHAVRSAGSGRPGARRRRRRGCDRLAGQGAGQLPEYEHRLRYRSRQHSGWSALTAPSAGRLSTGTANYNTDNPA